MNVVLVTQFCLCYRLHGRIGVHGKSNDDITVVRDDLRQCAANAAQRRAPILAPVGSYQQQSFAARQRFSHRLRQNRLSASQNTLQCVDDTVAGDVYLRIRYPFAQ